VVAPVSLHSVDKSDKAPQILNINGDPVAGEIAAALGAERLIFLTDVVLTTTSTTHIIDGRQPHALLKEIEEGGGGTTIGAGK